MFFQINLEINSASFPLPPYGTTNALTYINIQDTHTQQFKPDTLVFSPAIIYIYIYIGERGGGV